MVRTKHIDPADARLIWAFGKLYQFHWVTIVNSATNLVVPLDPSNYNFHGAHGSVGQRFQKSQIVLHGTDSNNEAKSTLDTFLTSPPQPPSGWRAAAHIIVERTRNHTRPESAADGVPPRAARIPRLRTDAVLDDTDDFIDVVRLVDLNASVIHGSSVNNNAIGIEHTNAQNDFNLVQDETKDPATGRPRDRNRWIHTTNAGSRDAEDDMQAFEDEQYNSIILMLRAICIEQRIPRQFLGDTWIEKSSHFTKGVADAAELRERRSKVFRFRGLIQHWNTEVKLCPGSFAMNRIFRGIIDEWWLPVELKGFVRPYYSGPFLNPTFTAPDNGGQPTKPAWFRWKVGAAGTVSVEASVYHDVNLDALTETRSYFDLDELNNYYKACETQEGGLFPIGHNRIWHGGVHLEPAEANPVVYAAASGTIVAARLSSNPITDAQPGYGSQRFVLIRHAVYWQTQATPNAPPGTNQQRINYDTDPAYVFSLYMHLAAIPDLYSEHAENPRWYNKWLRQKAAAANPATPDQIPSQAVLDADVGFTAITGGAKGKVFNPNVEVSVGDVLGVAGRFSEWNDPATPRKIIQFDVFSHRDVEITLAGTRHADDPKQDAVCDVNMINQELAAANVGPATNLHVLASRWRDLRVRHRSPWSWDSPDLLYTATVASVIDVNNSWPHVYRMMWVQDALKANPSLKTDLGDSNFFWHYHPITFMAAVNRLILGENREITQAPFETVISNVEVDENYFLTGYFDFVTGAFQPANADNKAVRPYEFEGTGFSVTRANLACGASTSVPPPPHLPNPIPQGTFFSLALLEIFERVAVRFNAALTISCASVCQGHVTEVVRCCRNEPAPFQDHLNGLAIDFHPARTQINIRKLWNDLTTVRDAYNAQAHLHAGTACHGNLPVGFGGVDFKAQSDDVANKLKATPQQALTSPEINAFCIHLALTPV